jgi:glycosyltransferase involved in cell wall biosynthesis
MLAPVNILQINQSDAGGGAARVAANLHVTFARLGHTPTMLVGHKQTDDARVRSIKRHVGWRAADRLTGAVTERLALQYVFYPSSFAVAYDEWFRRADVVQLHNLHGSYFSYSALPLLSRRRPIVWLLHDQWPLTGHVAYSLDCDRWRHGCGDCPYVDHLPALRRDTTALLWRWKRRVYGTSKLTIVAPSRWLAGFARESPLLRGFRVEHIPNGVDTNVFAPRPRDDARARLGVPRERRTVLFVSDPTNVPRKGLHLLEDALLRLDERPLLLVAGRGPVSDRLEVMRVEVDADTYAAADVVAHPSLADNFPNVVAESLACETPVVAFDVGGVRDVVRHVENGWLAPSGNVEALADGLRTFLADGELRARAGSAGRELVERELTLERQANAFLDLYAELAA